MPGFYKFALSSLLITLFAVAQAFCACAMVKQAIHDMPAMEEMNHHDHGAMVDMSGEDEPPCQHCEQGAEKAKLTTSTIAINAQAFNLQHVRILKTQPFVDFVTLPNNSALERRSWLDPPPTQNLHTPIALKIRLLT